MHLLPFEYTECHIPFVTPFFAFIHSSGCEGWHWTHRLWLDVYIYCFFFCLISWRGHTAELHHYQVSKFVDIHRNLEWYIVLLYGDVKHIIISCSPADMCFVWGRAEPQCGKRSLPVAEKFGCAPNYQGVFLNMTLEWQIISWEKCQRSDLAAVQWDFTTPTG